MTELRTLNDIEWRDLGITDAVDIVKNDSLRNGKIALYPSTIKVNLRAEAIKWIKEMQNTINKDRFSCFKISEEIAFYEDPYENSEISAVIMWIKHFFNINEADL